MRSSAARPPLFWICASASSLNDTFNIFALIILLIMRTRPTHNLVFLSQVRCGVSRMGSLSGRIGVLCDDSRHIPTKLAFRQHLVTSQAPRQFHPFDI